LRAGETDLADREVTAQRRHGEEGDKSEVQYDNKIQANSRKGSKENSK